MDQRSTQCLDLLQRCRHVVHLEIGKREGVARTLPTGMYPDRGRGFTRLPAATFAVATSIERDPQQAAPEAKGALGVVGGKLDKRGHQLGGHHTRLAKRVFLLAE